MPNEVAVQVFEVPPAAVSPWLASLLLVPVVILVVMAAVFWPRPLHVELAADTLSISGSVYGRRIGVGELLLERARAVDIEREPNLSITWRTNGVAFPGYRVGWFRLKNGERALCFLTRGSSVLYLPTRRNFSVLLSVTQPESLLAALRAKRNHLRG